MALATRLAVVCGAPGAVQLLLLSRSATGKSFHGVLNTGDVPLDVLHVQPSGHNLIVTDLEKRHPSHLKGLPVATGSRPAPLAPGRVSVLDRPTDLGAEVGAPANMAAQLARI